MLWSCCKVMAIVVIAAGACGGNVCPITVSDCPPVCNCSVQADAMFVDCSSKGLSAFPDRLPDCSVIHLNISRNSLTTVEYKQYTSNVRLLDVSFNAITSINKQFLSGNSAAKLEYLFLQNNELTDVSGQEISLFKRMKLISIHDNHWNCRCRISDLYDWIIEVKTRSVEKIENIDSVKCFSPEHLRNTAIVKLDEDDMCKDRISIWIPIVVTACCLLYLVVVSIVGICVVQRRRIKVVDTFQGTLGKVLAKTHRQQPDNKEYIYSD